MRFEPRFPKVWSLTVKDGDKVVTRYVRDMDWAEVARDYGRLAIPDFNAKYPAWDSDQAFMDRLREQFEKPSKE